MKAIIVTNSQKMFSSLSKILAEKDVSAEFSGGADIMDRVYGGKPDLIMLDVALVNPQATSVLERLKLAPSTRETPVIVVSPPNRTRKMSVCYKLGAYDHISCEPFFKGEIFARLRNIGYVRERLRELEKLIVRDHLTGLYNRMHFMERLKEELAWGIRTVEPLSVAMLDVDHFKSVNDTYGHGCGDEVLRKLACRIIETVRSYDVVARYGGEEFVILFPNTGRKGAIAAAERVRSALAEGGDFQCDIGKSGFRVTVSIGVTSTERQDYAEIQPEIILKQADDALYDAKRAGRDRVALHTPAQDACAAATAPRE